MSDGATPTRVAALIASGDLPADVVVVPGQAGSGSDEGTAMMEIIYDVAPGAKLFFATAGSGSAQFAANIRMLRFTYGCDIIVDDFSYFAESVFHGSIAAAVNDVTAHGALYFSSGQTPATSAREHRAPGRETSIPVRLPVRPSRPLMVPYSYTTLRRRDSTRLTTC